MNITKNQGLKRDLRLYIHIPFCERKCDYCDFLSATSTKETKHKYMEALVAEIKSYQGKSAQYSVPTIFIGGGTPSAVEATYIEEMMKAIREVFSLSPDAEISIELNPGTVDREKLLRYKAAGINRLSFGLQSTLEKELKLLGRIHSYEEFLQNYGLAQELGFTNINVDLMSALPGQTPEDWEKTLQRIVKLEPQHISAYNLIVEEGTPFYNRYGEDDSELPDEEVDQLIDEKTKDILGHNGYHRYEVSNYAKDGYECRHNESYWTGVEYLGLGLGSSSYLASTRFQNLTELDQYINLCSNDYNSVPIIPSMNKTCVEKDVEKETIGIGIMEDAFGLRRNINILSVKEKMEEFMFLGLRLTRGINKKTFVERFGVELNSVYGEVLARQIKEGCMVEEGDYLRLTDYGTDISNIVLAELLLP